MTSAFTNPFFSSLENRRRPENITAILNLFSEGPQASKFSICVTMNWYNTMMFMLKYCTEGIIAIKKGANYSNNKERCSQEIFCDSIANQSTQTLAGQCSLKLLVNVQCTLTNFFPTILKDEFSCDGNSNG